MKMTAVHFESVQSPWGWLAGAASDVGVCWLALGADESGTAEQLAREGFAPKGSSPDLRQVLQAMIRHVAHGEAAPAPHLDVRGTDFDVRVWDRLRLIPRGATMSYTELAHELGSPHGNRAVAGACARNRLALLIPCHRVLRADGDLGGFRWGIERKRSLLQAEGALSQPSLFPA